MADKNNSSAPGTFAERDLSKPAEQQGLFRKFEVRRVDGSDQPGGKHYGCRYYVLDLNHDQHAPAAMRAYAAACATTHPQLSADICAEFGNADRTQASVPERNEGESQTTQEGQGGLTDGLQPLETVQYWAREFAKDPERLAGGMIVKLLQEYAQLRAILARQPAPVISNAEAATWCRENSLNVPAHWESAPVQGSVVQADAHPDDIAVDRFAAAMKDKMAKSRAKGRGGWDDPAQCGTQDLADMLVDHIEKGDPVDIGNFAMMLWNRGAWAGDLVSALSQYVMRESREPQAAKYGPNNPPRLRKPGESVEDYRVAMGWDQPKPAALQERSSWTILHNGKSVSADTLTGCMTAARQLRTPEEAAKAAENLAAAIAAEFAEEQAERAAAALVDWLGLALDLEQQAKRVESQSVERAMLAGAHGLRLMGDASQQPAAERAAVPEGWKLVPVEPTEAMTVAPFTKTMIGGWKEQHRRRNAAIYRAMLAAAPAAQEGKAVDGVKLEDLLGAASLYAQVYTAARCIYGWSHDAALIAAAESKEHGPEACTTVECLKGVLDEVLRVDGENSAQVDTQEGRA